MRGASAHTINRTKEERKSGQNARHRRLERAAREPDHLRADADAPLVQDLDRVLVARTDLEAVHVRRDGVTHPSRGSKRREPRAHAASYPSIGHHLAEHVLRALKEARV